MPMPFLFRFATIAFIATLSAGCDRSIADLSSPHSSARISFGQRQLEQMVEDRPDMKDTIPPDHPVWTWLADGFDGKRFGQRIFWNGNSPQSGRPAEHAPQFGHYPAYISISGGSEISAVDKWTAAVFEMFNLEGNDIADLTSEALKGVMNADEFANKCVEMEFAALIKTQDFFRDHPLPASGHGRDKYYNWISANLGTFDEYKKSFDVPGATTLNSNFAYFKEYFNTTIVPYVNSARSREP